jgi:hypothetical protein
MCLSMTAIWAYIYRKPEVFAPNVEPRNLEGTALVWFFSSLGMLVALGASFIGTLVAAAIWVGWPWIVQSWGYRYRHPQQANDEIQRKPELK